MANKSLIQQARAERMALEALRSTVLPQAERIAAEFAARFRCVSPPNSGLIRFLPALPHVYADCALARMGQGCELICHREVPMASVNLVVLKGSIECEGEDCSILLGTGHSVEVPTECTRGIRALEDATILLVGIED